jgi:hypothetical protein
LGGGDVGFWEMGRPIYRVSIERIENGKESDETIGADRVIYMSECVTGGEK